MEVGISRRLQSMLHNLAIRSRPPTMPSQRYGAFARPVVPEVSRSLAWRFHTVRCRVATYRRSRVTALHQLWPLILCTTFSQKLPVRLEQRGFFYMDKTIPIPINVPGLCESNFVGDVKPVKCGTSEPYIEPKDLEKFVQENRVR